MYKISHSKTKTARRCLKAYQYKYVIKIQRKKKARPLMVGSLVHECVESYFKSGHYLPVIAKWRREEFDKMFKEEQSLHADIIPLVKAMMRGYIKNWKNSGLEMVWVEKPFLIEISPGIFLDGKIDGKARDDKERYWLVEHKSCKSMPGEEVRMFDTQVLTYAQILPLLGDKVNGVMWDYLRTKLPAKPELLAKGGLSKRKNIDTTAEVYRREIHRHGLDEEGYEDILSDLEGKRDAFYRQVFLPLNNTMGERILSDMIITSRQMMELEKRHLEDGEDCFTRNLTRDCSWCEYNTLCYAELRGDDTSYLMKHDYKPRKKDEKESQIEVDAE